MNFENKFDEFIEKMEPFLIIVIVASFVGVVGGVIGAFFLKTIDVFVEFREVFYYVLFALPLIGCFVVYLNRKYKCDGDGALLVNKAVVNEKDIPDYVAPVLFASTTLSHLAGASVGRMEAPIKMGGAIGNFIAKFFGLLKKDRSTVIASGVSGLFGAVFGLPVTGTVFAYELCYSKKNKKPIYIVPVFLSACFARFICFAFGLDSFVDRMIYLHHPEISLNDIILIIVLIGLCLGFTVLFNKTLCYVKDLFSKIRNEYIRVIVGSLVMIGAVCLIGNMIFCGNDTILVEMSLESNSYWYIFILKTLLTSVCLAVGFRGGNIGPAFIAGATFGILISSLMGLDPLVGAMIGSVCLFGGVTGCFVSAIILGTEIFGLSSIWIYVIIAIMIRYFINNGYIER